MHGPKWPFLLMYRSHNMRHKVFRRLTGCQRDTPGSGHHKIMELRLLKLGITVGNRVGWAY